MRPILSQILFGNLVSMFMVFVISEYCSEIFRMLGTFDRIRNDKHSSIVWLTKFILFIVRFETFGTLTMWAPYEQKIHNRRRHTITFEIYENNN